MMLRKRNISITFWNFLFPITRPTLNFKNVNYVNYVTQFLEKARIDPIEIDSFRIELRHSILWKSTSMRRRCVICGLASLPLNESTSWVEFNNCKRCTHIHCVSDLSDTDVANVSSKYINFFCVICEANTQEQATNVNHQDLKYSF